MTITALDIVTDALRELGVLNAVDPASGEDGTLALFRLNKLLDNLNADHNGVYADVLSTFTITPALQPHTLGPTGTWVLTQRPQVLSPDAVTVVNGSVYERVFVRDKQWYSDRTDPTETANVPTDVWYDPTWPNGSLYFVPIPSTAATVRLFTRALLASLAIGDTFTLPPGYQDLLTCELALDCQGPFRIGASQETKEKARLARQRVLGNNTVVPRLRTVDYGMPSGGGSTFDYLTGRTI